MKPITLFDKSFLQSLSLDEAVMFDNFFMSIICPLFYVETLGDLEKAVREGRTQEEEVGIIAQKTPELSGNPCPHHNFMCIANLMGESVPMDGNQIPRGGGDAVKVDGRNGIVYKVSPQAAAFHRWQAGKFLEVERHHAKAWRNHLNSIDLKTVAAGLRTLGMNPQNFKSLEDAKKAADRFIRKTDRPLDQLKLTFLILGLPSHYEPEVAARWKARNYEPLIAFAPYAAFLLNAQIFFQIGLGAGLISERSSNTVDMAYLSYLPFSMIFVSSDKLHRKTAPLFLRNNQSFVWGDDLKRDLARLSAKYKALPAEELEKGLFEIAHTPPRDEDYLVTKLCDHHWRIVQDEAETRMIDEAFEDKEAIDAFNGPVPLPKDPKELHAELKKVSAAAPLPIDKIDFDTKNPEMVSVERQIRRKRGSFYQVPKNLKE